MLKIGSQWLVAVALASLALTGGSAIPAPGAQCSPTRPDAEGPFYEPNSLERSGTGKGLVVRGTVRSAPTCDPISGARIEWWSANPRGQYDEEHRATQRVDGQGRYRYETDFPGRYPGRPPHLHVRVTAPGHRPLVSQLYPKSGETVIHFDFVLVRQ